MDPAGIDEMIAHGTRIGMTRRLLNESRQGYASGMRFLREKTASVLATGGYVLPHTHPMFITTSDLVHDALRRIVDLDEQWTCRGLTAADVAQVTRDLPKAETSSPSANEAPAAPLGPRRNPIRVSELLEKHISRTNPPSSTEAEQRLAVRRFLNVLGEDMFVHQVDYAHAEKFYEILLWLPRGRTSDEDGMPLAQLADAVRTGALQKPRITKNTADKQIALLGAMFRWARNRGFTPIEPFTQLVLPGTAPGVRRRPFREQEIAVIFGVPLFTGCAREKQWRDPGTHLIANHRFWLPLLALVTGARIEESGQLTVTDVKRAGDTLYLDITEEVDTDDPDDDVPYTKSLKTRSSIRTVPVHKIALDAGFAEFVEFRRSSGSGPVALFPEFPRSGKKTKEASRTFNRDFLASVGITDAAARFHSFRHLFKDRCRTARLPVEVHDALTGHANRSVGAEYGEGVPIEVLKGAVDLLTFPGYRPVPRRTLRDFQAGA